MDTQNRIRIRNRIIMILYFDGIKFVFKPHYRKKRQARQRKLVCPGSLLKPENFSQMEFQYFLKTEDAVQCRSLGFGPRAAQCRTLPWYVAPYRAMSRSRWGVGVGGRAPLSHEPLTINSRSINELFDCILQVVGISQISQFQNFKVPKFQSFKIPKFPTSKFAKLSERTCSKQVDV